LLDQLGARADIVLGGGSKWFFDRVKDPEVIYKGDERTVVQRTQKKMSSLAAAVFEEWESFRAYDPPKDDSKPVLGVFFLTGFPTTRMEREPCGLWTWLKEPSASFARRESHSS
jgi:hypothetical protein